MPPGEILDPHEYQALVLGYSITNKNKKPKDSS